MAKPPFVPVDADLRGMDFMPLKGDHLFHSETWIEASPEGRCAALRLWWHAFSKEVPAGTLPDNDKLLAAYAGYGETVRAWKKIRSQAMRGWISDGKGRLHHEFLGKIVCESWERRLDYREENDARAERQRRWRERVRQLTKALRQKGITAPKGAKLEALEKLCVDAGVDVSAIYKSIDVDATVDGGEIGKTVDRDRDRDRDREKKLIPSGTAPPSAEPTSAPGLPLGDENLDLPLCIDRSIEAKAVRLWNETAERVNGELGRTEWPTVQKLSSGRRKAIRARLKDLGGIDDIGLEGWKLALDKASKSRWLRGETPRSPGHEDWRFNLDTLVREKFLTQLMEKPDDDDPSRRSKGRTGTDAELAGIVAARSSG